MEISFEGIGQVCATFEVEGAVQPGMAVAVSGSGKVSAAGAGAKVCGRVMTVKNDMAAVQIFGAAQLSYSGSGMEPGWKMIAGDGAGGIKTVTSGGNEHLILSVNTAAKCAVIKL